MMMVDLILEYGKSKNDGTNVYGKKNWKDFCSD